MTGSTSCADSSSASTPPASELATSAALSTARVRPIIFSNSSPLPVSVSTASYTIASVVPLYIAK